MTRSSKPVSPITARFAGLSPAALKVLGRSGPGMAEILLSAVPRNVKDSAVKDPGSPINLVSNIAVRDIFIQSIISIHYLFAEIAPALHVPDPKSLEQANVDFVKLAEAYEAYGKEGVEPELILGPVNLSLDYWRKKYSSLGTWQDINDPRSPHKLRQGGDGLWVLEYIERHYHEIIGKYLDCLPGRRIINGGGESLAITGDGLPTGNVVWQAAVIPSGETVRKENASKLSAPYAEKETDMPIGHYLTLQAERLYLKKPPIDKNSSTKLGFVTNAEGENNCWISLGNFGTMNGQVYLHGYEIKARRQNMDKEWGNIRIPVWG
jgi:hypothetical protein